MTVTRGIDWLPGMDKRARQRLITDGAELVFHPGQRVFGLGERCQGLPILHSGCIRVEMLSAAGSEIVLYRIEPGQMCTLSIACLLDEGLYHANAVAEQESEALLVPPRAFDDLMADSAAFRRAVLRGYGARLQSLMLLVEELAFRRVDARLAELLIQRADHEGAVHATHQQLATELGTAREVVTRLLGEFERAGWIERHRGWVRIVDPAALAQC
ncbi:Crp/Fnr family transcriptional regulator [Arhodomonas sp. SL1]|uniref:Crp/Fnr family transcriptional regulator n=1 Tax=Arhodomonas sp. SL1 TaxID=3425691 RepID=UPI003F88392C